MVQLDDEAVAACQKASQEIDRCELLRQPVPPASVTAIALALVNNKTHDPEDSFENVYGGEQMRYNGLTSGGMGVIGVLRDFACAGRSGQIEEGVINGMAFNAIERSRDSLNELIDGCGYPDGIDRDELLICAAVYDSLQTPPRDWDQMHDAAAAAIDGARDYGMKAGYSNINEGIPEKVADRGADAPAGTRRGDAGVHR